MFRRKAKAKTVSYSTKWIAEQQIKIMRGAVAEALRTHKANVPFWKEDEKTQEYRRQLEIQLAMADSSFEDLKRIRARKKRFWDSFRIRLWKWATKGRFAWMD